MNEVLFVQQREPDWQRLTFLCDRADVSPTQLHADELHELYRLYKRVSADLSLARTQSGNAELVEFLNGLCGRAYGLVYRTPVMPLPRAIYRALEVAAQTVRRRFRPILAATLLFLGAAVLAFMVIRANPDAKAAFVPAGWDEVVEQWRSGTKEERTAGESLMATFFYGSNNPLVSIMNASLGASTFGLQTVQVMFTNGALIGALVQELVPVNRVGYLFVRIFPHGVTELSGIFISGGAGFVMAGALIAPGRRSRAQALKEAGKDAIVLLVIAVVMMFIAAPIEGFFSFNPNVPDAAKILFSLLSAAGWAAFWIGFGRENTALEQAELK